MHKPAVRGTPFRIVHQWIVMAFISDCVLLGWLGSQPVERPFVIIGQIRTAGFFVLVMLLCVNAHLENWFASKQFVAVKASSSDLRLFRFFSIPQISILRSVACEKSGRTEEKQRSLFYIFFILLRLLHTL